MSKYKMLLAMCSLTLNAVDFDILFGSAFLTITASCDSSLNSTLFPKFCTTGISTTLGSLNATLVRFSNVSELNC